MTLLNAYENKNKNKELALQLSSANQILNTKVVVSHLISIGLFVLLPHATSVC